MGEVNFYLKKPETSTGKSLIVLYKNYHGKRLVYSTGETILPNTWNSNKQRVKNNSATTKEGEQYLNDFLTGLAKECERAYSKALVNGIPAPETLRLALLNYMHHKIDGSQEEKTATLFKLIERFISNEIKHKGRDKSINTIRTYQTCKKHLQDFEKVQKTKLDFSAITLDFYYQYVSFLKTYEVYKLGLARKVSISHIEKVGKKKGLGQNAISKDIAIIKVFMGEAVDLGYTTNMQFLNKKFAVSRVETDAIYLKEKELVDLYRYDLSSNKKLENVRDLFLFGCFTGLRFSDYSTVKAENIVKDGNDYFIKLITKKTNSLVIIPCNPIILELFKKYDNSPNKLPKSISNQTFNEYIKEACKEAGLTETGRLSTQPTLELCDAVTSHSARRSFATNLYLEGFPTLDIMKITGHSTEKAFMKYIRFNKLDAAKRLSEHIKRNWSEKMLRVAI